MFHAFLGEKLPDWKAAANLVRKIAENYKLPYYTMSPTYSVCRTHGYLAGEVLTCPHCGEKTEVYSRITGYYRPVQNWNDGKAQEYRDRLVYSIDHATITKELLQARANGTIDCDCEKAAEPCECETPAAEGNARVMLFATATCPKCKVAAAMLEKEGIPFVKLLVEENEELARAYGLRQAPTLVVESEGKFATFAEITGVKDFIASYVKA